MMSSTLIPGFMGKGEGLNRPPARRSTSRSRGIPLGHANSRKTRSRERISARGVRRPLGRMKILASESFRFSTLSTTLSSDSTLWNGLSAVLTPPHPCIERRGSVAPNVKLMNKHDFLEPKILMV